MIYDDIVNNGYIFDVGVCGKGFQQFVDQVASLLLIVHDRNLYNLYGIRTLSESHEPGRDLPPPLESPKLQSTFKFCRGLNN